MRAYQIFGKKAYAYFITCTVVEWQKVFLEQKYSDLIIESLSFCCREKGLVIHAYVIMPNHIHLVLSCGESENLSGIIRDFRHFTAKRIIYYLREDGRDAILSVFKTEAERKFPAQKYKVWMKDFHPVALYSDKWIEQKMNYIHENPVRKNLVENPEDWKYSSAVDWLTDNNGLLPVKKGFSHV